MADAQLNIITKVSGQKEYNDLVDKINAGTASINEIARAAKLSDQIFKNLKGTLDDAVRPAIAASTVALKEMKDKALEPVTTANGRMMRSYFQSGEALRIQTLFANGLKNGFQSLGMETDRATKLSDSFASKLGLMVGVAGAAVGAIMALRKAFNMAEESARMELLQSTMQQMAAKDGVDFAKILDQINGKIGNMVSHYEILQGAMKLSLLDVGWNRMADVMLLAEQRSKLIGVSFTEMLNVLEQAAMGGQRALKKMLMPQDFSPEKVYREYAESLGVLADELSDVGKKHAMFNAILKTAAEQNLQINKAADEQLEKYEHLDTAWKNLGEEVGKFATNMAPAVSFLATFVGWMKTGIEKANDFKWSLVGMVQGMNQWLKEKGFQIPGVGTGNGGKAEHGIGVGGQVSAAEYDRMFGTHPGATPIIPEFTYGPTSEDINPEKVAKRKAEEHRKRLAEIKEAQKAYAERSKQIFEDGKKENELNKQNAEDTLNRYEVSKELSDEDAKRINFEKIDADTAKQKLEWNLAAADSDKDRLAILKMIQSIDKKENDDQKKADKDHEKAMRDAEEARQAAYEDVVQGIASINDGLSAMGVKSDSFVSKLAQAAQYALQIAKAMGKSDFGSFGDIAGVAGSGLGILALLAKGGDVFSGTRLQFAANGMNIKYGNDVQAVMMGERGPELGLFGKNGARIISNNNLQTINRMNSSAMGGMPQLVSGELKVSGGNLVFAYTLANQARSGRKF